MEAQSILLESPHTICILAGVAFVIASYMALYQWRLIEDVWDPVFGEQTPAGT